MSAWNPHLRYGIGGIFQKNLAISPKILALIGGRHEI